MQLPTPSTPRTSTPAALRRGKSAKGPIAALALATPSGSGRTTPARSSKRGRRATRGASIGDRASEDAATGLKADTGADQRSVTTPSVVAGDVVGLAVGTPGGEGEMLVVKRRRGRPPKIRDGVVGAGMGVAVALALAKKEEGKGTPSAVGRGKDKDREKKEEESGAEAEKEVRRSGRERHPSSLIKN